MTLLESLSDRQRSTRGVNLGRCVRVGAGLTPWAVTGKGSSQVIPRTGIRLETAVDQNQLATTNYIQPICHKKTNARLIGQLKG